MSREEVEHALSVLPEGWDLSGAEGLDADGVVDLVHVSGLEATLSFVPEPGHIVLLYAVLGTPEDQLAVYRQILEGAHLWSGTGSLSMGLRPGTEEIAAFTAISFGDGFQERFAQVLRSFAEDCLTWADIVAGGSEGEETEPHDLVDPMIRI